MLFATKTLSRDESNTMWCKVGRPYIFTNYVDEMLRNASDPEMSTSNTLMLCEHFQNGQEGLMVLACK